MPDRQSNASAIEDLDAQLQARWPGAVQLDATTLAKRFPSRDRLVAAWRVPVAIPDPADALLVSVDCNFPWTLPRIALVEPTNGITFPHVEVDGHICVAPSSAVYELPVGLRHVEALVEDAAAVLAQGTAEANEEDFFTEAHSYWGLIEPTAGSFLVLSEPPTSHALWSAATCGPHVVVGESAKAISEWSRRAQQKISAPEQALLLALDAPLHPREYPLTPRDLVCFAERVGGSQALRSTVMKWNFKTSLRVLISFPYSGRRIYLGAELQTPQSVRLPGAKKPGTPGFRPKAKTATARLVALSQNPKRFRHWRAVPIYRSFLRERTAGLSAAPLERCHVVVVGCGALGGQLAVQLAQAGVGQLTLLDIDVMDWRNVGRHVLDGASVGRDKALALKDAILRRFPDAEVAAFARSWEEHIAIAPSVFDQADLIISATAEPASNLHLDQLSKSGAIAPVVFGWMEPFAVSAHAVLRYPSGAGLADITDAYGLLAEPVVDRATAPALPQEPSCGAFFQPYSSLSALACVCVVAELAVDALLGRVAHSTVRTWVGPASAFHDNGLSITPVWHGRLNSQGFSRLYGRPIAEVME